MLIIISPSLTMQDVDMNFEDLTIPNQIDKARNIVHKIKLLTYSEMKSVMGINDKLVELNKLRYDNIKFDNMGKPALLSYTGTVYKSIKANTFNRDEIEFCKNHLRILSGLYGVLKPYDSIYEYRLEMKTKIGVNGCKDLYEYFGRSIYEKIICEDREIINLCSGEYSKALIPYLTSEDRFITCTFKIRRGDSLKTLSTDAKQTRGMMVNYIVKNNIQDRELLKEFNENGYSYDETLSSENEYIFLK